MAIKSSSPGHPPPKQPGLACGHRELTSKPAGAFNFRGWQSCGMDHGVSYRGNSRGRREPQILRVHLLAPAVGVHPLLCRVQSLLWIWMRAFWGPADALGTGTNIHYLEQLLLSIQGAGLKETVLVSHVPPAPEGRDTWEGPRQAKHAHRSAFLQMSVLGGTSGTWFGEFHKFLCPVHLHVFWGPVPVLPTQPIVDGPQCRQNNIKLEVEAIREENLLLKSQCEELHGKNLEMEPIVDGFEGIGHQTMEAQKKKEFGTKSRRFWKKKTNLLQSWAPWKNLFPNSSGGLRNRRRWLKARHEWRTNCCQNALRIK